MMLHLRSACRDQRLSVGVGRRLHRLWAGEVRVPFCLRDAVLVNKASFSNIAPSSTTV